MNVASWELSSARAVRAVPQNLRVITIVWFTEAMVCHLSYLLTNHSVGLNKIKREEEMKLAMK